MAAEATSRSNGWFRRSSGLILHPTSLPGPYGIGDFGAQATGFVDFLASAGQRLWQILPLGPTGYGNSPYAARSAFAGNPLLISLDLLADDGLIDRSELEGPPPLIEERVDFDAVAAFKMPLLRRAATRLAESGSSELRSALDAFVQQQASWLEDFALFMAYRESRNGEAWQKWPAAVRDREPEALQNAREKLTDEIAFQNFAQFAFYHQWGRLRQYANERDVQLIGDIPIFVALDSVDVWANRDIFFLDERGNPTVVAGVPPDYFSKTGQRWGNPLYRWDVLADTGYRWWIERLRATLALVDIIRVDHFRGFHAYWEIPAEETTAVKGRWAEGPGTKFFDAAKRELGELPMVVEDLGFITRGVRELRQALGYPGMRVLHFAWSGPANPFLPHNYEPHTVAYTGTHDNDTTIGWYHSTFESDRDSVRRYLGVSGDDIAWDFIRLALGSVATFAIFPVQDVLRLGSEARMNFPGRPEGNWAWRLHEGQLTDEHAWRLRELVEMYGRLLGPEDDEPEGEPESPE
jgi:4-alpha-glucanotransferase